MLQCCKFTYPVLKWDHEPIFVSAIIFSLNKLSLGFDLFQFVKFYFVSVKCDLIAENYGRF